jgi:nucleotide-binding universal stress UspA family protein
MRSKTRSSAHVDDRAQHAARATICATVHDDASCASVKQESAPFSTSAPSPLLTVTALAAAALAAAAPSSGVHAIPGSTSDQTAPQAAAAGTAADATLIAAGSGPHEGLSTIVTASKQEQPHSLNNQLHSPPTQQQQQQPCELEKLVDDLMARPMLPEYANDLSKEAMAALAAKGIEARARRGPQGSSSLHRGVTQHK